ncbi:hypothetical protein Ancab_013120 [Ancistrocladus abbreviatus]
MLSSGGLERIWGLESQGLACLGSYSNQYSEDQKTGNWWLYLWGAPIGYWPKSMSIYNRGPLATSGDDTILWGGEIASYGLDRGYHSKTQMGSGHFPSEGYRNASYVRDLVYTDTSGKPTALAQNQLNGYASVPNCYKCEFEQLNSSLYFFYGGPGCN